MSTQIGSSFDDFLEEQGLLDECSAVAAKRVLAWQLQQVMEKAQVSKSELARKMDTSRAQLNRLLDPENPSVNLQTMERAARMLGKKL
ncbi:MAG: helix-turn-helix domain-containing protein, partial [Desulfovibrio sp.]|nr:helix-turn-helix domain-containing protein [Desulfovibrio sp.]